LARRPPAVSLGLLLVLLLSLALMTSTALAAAPTIPVATVSAVTTKAAVLEASVNPEGEATTYQFQYGLADCASNPCASIPAVAAGIGSGSEAVRVAKEVSGLEPGTTYHFRVVATNGSGTTNGPNRTFTTYAPFVPNSDCPNQVFRWGSSANLPDCRAYEMVSPVEKVGRHIGRVQGGFEPVHSSLDGEKVAFKSGAPFGDAAAGALVNTYIASRGGSAWSSHALNPPQGQTIFDPNFEVAEFDLFQGLGAFTPDLSSAWMNNFNRQPLAPGGREGVENLYRRDNLTDSYEAISVADPFFGPDSYESSVGGFSDDGSQVVFMTPRPLTPDAALHTNRQVYRFSGGQIELISVLPNGEANPESSFVGTGHYTEFRYVPSWGSLDNAVSDDGSRVVWSSAEHDTGGTGDDGVIYVSVEGEPSIPVSESVTGKDAVFWTADPDVSKVLFSYQAVEGGTDDDQLLYEFDVDTETSTLIAGEVAGVAGASDDLSDIYFVSLEDLDAGATAGEPNFYLSHEGAIRFIATADELGLNLSPLPTSHAARVTPDGRHLLFVSQGSPTGYDNTDAVTGEPDEELFLYDADTDELVCVSCNPSGARPTGERRLEEPGTEAAATVPGWVDPLYELRPLSEDGNRVFFNAFDSLVPQDSNGALDVYQWEAPGTGACEVGGTGYSAQNGGCVSLISTGQSPSESQFADADPSGESVFFRTESSIDPDDPGLFDLYVARVGGGYPQPPAQNPCVGDACQSIPPAPNDPTPASASFRGAGDPAPRKARRRCRARGRKAGRVSAQAKRGQAKRCRRANRRAGR
jgi:hypothetical protein